MKGFRVHSQEFRCRYDRDCSRSWHFLFQGKLGWTQLLWGMYNMYFEVLNNTCLSSSELLHLPYTCVSVENYMTTLYIYYIFSEANRVNRVNLAKVLQKLFGFDWYATNLLVNVCGQIIRNQRMVLTKPVCFATTPLLNQWLTKRTSLAIRRQFAIVLEKRYFQVHVIQESKR